MTLPDNTRPSKNVIDKNWEVQGQEDWGVLDGINSQAIGPRSIDHTGHLVPSSHILGIDTLNGLQGCPNSGVV